MDMNGHLDITFDFRSDTPKGRDPDAFSPTLRRYHKRLWSKPLPSGEVFELDDAIPRGYLHHRSALGEFFLSSDSVIPTFSGARRISHIIDQIPVEDREAFRRKSYTIGGMMVFPGNRIRGGMTINGARGFHYQIKDRFDLTVECIRRHYLNESNPLNRTLTLYADFFRLFGDFRGYVTFFQLQDLVTENCSSVRFFLPFQDFKTSPLPASVDAYAAYRQLAMDFIEARNQRILESCSLAGLDRLDLSGEKRRARGE
jgi:hypothetical protein